MTDRQIIISLVVSLLIHLSLIPAASVILLSRNPLSSPTAVTLLEISQSDKGEESVTPVSLTKPQAKITAPKLLSKPQILRYQSPDRAKDSHEQEKAAETPPPKNPKSALPETVSAPEALWGVGSKPGEVEGSAAGSGNLFDKAHEDFAGGMALRRGGDGQGGSEFSRGGSGDSTSGGPSDSGKALSSLARPLGGYQIKPQYPDAARRAGAQGTTVLRLRILETGRVEEVRIEKSTGRRDLDEAAAEAARKWLFEPARVGKEPVAVWVTLPVEFKLLD